MGKVVTISVDTDNSLIGGVQIFLDLWANNTQDYQQRLDAINLIAEINRVIKEPKEYIATLTTSEQVSEDSWRVIHPSLKINSNTRMIDIAEFWDKKVSGKPLELSIIELENINP